MSSDFLASKANKRKGFQMKNWLTETRIEEWRNKGAQEWRREEEKCRRGEMEN